MFGSKKCLDMKSSVFDALRRSESSWSSDHPLRTAAGGAIHPVYQPEKQCETRREIERLQRELAMMRQRDTELSTLFKRLYEDNVLGRVTNEQFRMLSGEYNEEQKNLKDRIPQTVERIEKLQASISNVTRFIDKAKRYTEINELSSELLNIFIEKIEVGERAERYSRTAEQEIVIHYRDIGVVGAFAEEAEKISEQRQRQTA